MERIIFLTIRTNKEITEEMVKKYFSDRQDIWKSIACSKSDKELKEDLKKIDELLVVRNVDLSYNGFISSLVVKDNRYFTEKSQLDVLLISLLNFFKYTCAKIVTKDLRCSVEAEVDKTCTVFEVK